MVVLMPTAATTYNRLLILSIYSTGLMQAVPDSAVPTPAIVTKWLTTTIRSWVLRRTPRKLIFKKHIVTLARKYHPDLHPDDKTAKAKFQKVQAAFDVLNDTSKRELYDRYGSAFESAAAAGASGAGAGPRGGQAWYTQGSPGGFEELDFGQMFGERFGQSEGGGSPFADLFGGFQRAADRRAKAERAAPPSNPGQICKAKLKCRFKPRSKAARSTSACSAVRGKPTAWK